MLAGWRRSPPALVGWLARVVPALARPWRVGSAMRAAWLAGCGAGWLGRASAPLRFVVGLLLAERSVRSCGSARVLAVAAGGGTTARDGQCFFQAGRAGPAGLDGLSGSSGFWQVLMDLAGRGGSCWISASLGGYRSVLMGLDAPRWVLMGLGGSATTGLAESRVISTSIDVSRCVLMGLDESWLVLTVQVLLGLDGS